MMKEMKSKTKENKTMDSVKSINHQVCPRSAEIEKRREYFTPFERSYREFPTINLLRWS